jgi:hypothetical protein
MLKRLPLFCEKCGLLLETPADLVCAHVIDGDPTAGWYPACRPCNEADKTRPARSATCAPDLWPAETAEFFHRDTRP